MTVKQNPLDRMITPNNAAASSPAPTPLDLIPTARQVKKEKKNEKSLEKRKESRAAFDRKYPCYPYHIPELVHEEAKAVRALVLGIAQNKESNINVTEIEMTTKFVIWSLEQVRKGTLSITGKPDCNRRKMTVVVEDNDNGWDITPLDLKPGKKKIPAKRLVFTYRFPPDVTAQINELAGPALPKGEVLVRLLQHAVRAYKNRDVRIKTTPAEARQSAIIVDANPGDSWA
jgi:hypothetical protein